MMWQILFTVLFVCIVANGDLNNNKKTINNLHKIDIMKRNQILIKFEKQLISSLSVPPAFSIDATPRQKWMQLPQFVRKRLMKSSSKIEHANVETKEIFVPVKIVEQCSSKNVTQPHICVNFRLDQTTLQTSTETAVLYLDLPHQPKPLSNYLIMQDHLSTNESLSLMKMNGNLFEVNINNWIKNSDNGTNNKNYQFAIICNGECKDESFMDAQLFLEVTLESKRLARSRRSTDEAVATCSQDEIMCCKRSFVFRPIDIGWNWIVHPDEIRLNYCMGECNDQTSNYTYSRVLSLLKRSKNANLTPQQLESMKFCCAPKSYSGLEVVYLTNTNNSFQKMHLSNMIVDTCACV